MRSLSTLVAVAMLSSGVLGSGYTQSNGQTKLVGSSFGVLGLNKTFDYVVRSRSNVCYEITPLYTARSWFWHMRYQMTALFIYHKECSCGDND